MCLLDSKTQALLSCFAEVIASIIILVTKLQRPKKSELSGWQLPTRKNFPGGVRKSFSRQKKRVNRFRDTKKRVNRFRDKWLVIAKLKPLSLFISVLLMLKKALDNVKMEK